MKNMSGVADDLRYLFKSGFNVTHRHGSTQKETNLTKRKVW